MAKKKEFIFEELTSNDKKESVDIKKNIIIKDEFKNFIPPLSDEEYALLESNILSEGIRDALIVWENKGTYILIDGHNRLSIAQKHHLDYKIEVKTFASNDEAFDWMVNNQLGKRNLTNEQKSYLRGKQYKAVKNKPGGTGKNQYSSSDILSEQQSSKMIAKMQKVSNRTIERDEKYAEAIDKISGDDKILKWQILSREVKIPKSAIVKVLEMNDNQVSKIRNDLKTQNKIIIDKPKTNDTYSSDITAINKELKEMIQQKDDKHYKNAKSLLDQLYKKVFKS